VDTRFGDYADCNVDSTTGVYSCSCQDVPDDCSTMNTPAGATKCNNSNGCEWVDDGEYMAPFPSPPFKCPTPERLYSNGVGRSCDSPKPPNNPAPGGVRVQDAIRTVAPTSPTTSGAPRGTTTATGTRPPTSVATLQGLPRYATARKLGSSTCPTSNGAELRSEGTQVQRLTFGMVRTPPRARGVIDYMSRGSI
jgi:hypothetical protein